MEKTVVPLSEVYKIADKMARPWQYTVAALSVAVICLAICIALHHC